MALQCAKHALVAHCLSGCHWHPSLWPPLCLELLHAMYMVMGRKRCDTTPDCVCTGRIRSRVRSCRELIDLEQSLAPTVRNSSQLGSLLQTPCAPHNRRSLLRLQCAPALAQRRSHQPGLLPAGEAPLAELHPSHCESRDAARAAGAHAACSHQAAAPAAAAAAAAWRQRLCHRVAGAA